MEAVGVSWVIASEEAMSGCEERVGVISGCSIVSNHLTLSFPKELHRK
jgi:hypothetical protein